MDAVVYHLQGKAEGVTTDLAHRIRDFYLARLGLLMRHEEVARHVGQYDANNAYQYVINREETHVSWLQHALLDLGAAIPADPARPVVQTGSGSDAWKALAADDASANHRNGRGHKLALPRALSALVLGNKSAL